MLYFTGHGLKDDQGRLYLAMTNTKRDRLLFTGLSAQQIDEAMESCSSRQKVLVLDCCYSGAFPADRIAKTDPQVNTLEKFQGKGRVVLTASDATQYSFEGNHITGEGTRSVFTRFLIEGLTTGEADLDGDGNISLDELYSYVHDRVIAEMPQQRPKKQENVEGRIVIARNIHWSLPPHVRNAIESPFPRERLTVLEGLAHLHRVGNDLVKAKVIDQTRRLIHDDSKAVSEAARELITSLSPELARREAEKRRGVPADSPSPRYNSTKEQLAAAPPRPSPGVSGSPATNHPTGSDAMQPTAVQRPDQAAPDTRYASAAESTRDYLTPTTAGMATTETTTEASAAQTRRIRTSVFVAAVVVGVIILGTIAVLAGISGTPASSPASSPATALPVTTTIAVGSNPLGVAISPDGRHAYIVNNGSNTVSVIDTATNTVTATIPVGVFPIGVAITPDGRHAYVADYNSAAISVIDTGAG